MDQILRTRGQVSVSFWEQLREVTHELSQEQLQQLFEMYSKALNPDNYEFRLEVQTDALHLMLGYIQPCLPATAAMVCWRPAH